MVAVVLDVEARNERTIELMDEEKEDRCLASPFSLESSQMEAASHLLSMDPSISRHIGDALHPRGRSAGHT
jgi:hypothetical protein